MDARFRGCKLRTGRRAVSAYRPDYGKRTRDAYGRRLRSCLRLDARRIITPARNEQQETSDGKQRAEIHFALRGMVGRLIAGRLFHWKFRSAFADPVQNHGDWNSVIRCCWARDFRPVGNADRSPSDLQYRHAPRHGRRVVRALGLGAQRARPPGGARAGQGRAVGGRAGGRANVTRFVQPYEH